MAFPLTNVVSYYKLDETSGNAFDSVGGVTGTNVGTATFTPGKIGNALTLNGSSQALSLNGALLNAYATCTISAWIKLGATGAYQRIVSKTDDSTYNTMIRVTNGNKLAGHITTSSEATITGGTTLSSGVWYFVTLVYDGANINLYLNGSTDAAQVAKTGSLKTSTNVVSIGDYYSGGEWFNGQIDEVGIWNRALSSTEVTDLYNSGNGLSYPLTGSLVSYYKLDTNSNDSVTTNNGTDTDISYTTVGKIGNCATYNNTTSRITLPDVFRSTSYTISCWIKTSAVSKGIFGNTNYTASVASGVFILVSASGYLTAGVWNGSNAVSVDVNSTKVINDNIWHHCVMTCSGGTVNTLYVDGVQVATASGTSIGWSAYTNYVSWGDANFAGWVGGFNGSIDEGAIWSRALTADEVAQVYNSGRGNTYPLVDTPTLYGGISYWKLDESSGNAVDSVGINTLTNNNVTYSTGKINNGGVFNGSSAYLDGGDISAFEGLGTFSMFVWVYPTTDNVRGMILSKDLTGQRSFYLDRALSGDNKIGFTFGDGSTGECAAPAVAKNVWTHIIVTYDKNISTAADRLKIYYNGLIQSLTIATNFSGNIPITTSKFQVGARDTSGVFFTGTLDEVGFWGRALSTNEILALYNFGRGNQYNFLYPPAGFIY